MPRPFVYSVKGRCHNNSIFDNISAIACRGRCAKYITEAPLQHHSQDDQLFR